MFDRIRISHALAFVLLGLIAISISMIAQTPAQTGPLMRFTATTANVSGAPDSVRFDVLAWSTDADRDQMAGAWNLTAVPAPAGARGAGAAAGAGARGGAGGGRGRGGEAGARGDAPEAAAGANGSGGGGA